MGSRGENSSEFLASVVRRGAFGYEYHENLTFHFAFEEVDPFFWIDFCERYWKLPFYFGAIYIFAIFSIREYMRNRPAFSLKWPLFFWNLSLGIFSIVGFIRILPGFLKVFELYGFYTSICEKKGADVQSGAWLTFFALSKFWELGDTGKILKVKHCYFSVFT